MTITCENNIFNYSHWYNKYDIYRAATIAAIFFWYTDDRVKDIYSKQLLLFSNILLFFSFQFYYSVQSFHLSIYRSTYLEIDHVKNFHSTVKTTWHVKIAFWNNSWKMQFVYFRERILSYFCVLMFDHRRILNFQFGEKERYFFSFLLNRLFFFPSS